ncbi:hypothetical protein DR64_7896 [Paraburkholderia xenovorans LB400]|nr:hypothetical protein DR64_7896 [Paraburkholderia xenovorans LB400]
MVPRNRTFNSGRHEKGCARDHVHELNGKTMVIVLLQFINKRKCDECIARHAALFRPCIDLLKKALKQIGLNAHGFGGNTRQIDVDKYPDPVAIVHLERLQFQCITGISCSQRTNIASTVACALCVSSLNELPLASAVGKSAKLVRRPTDSSLCSVTPGCWVYNLRLTESARTFHQTLRVRIRNDFSCVIAMPSRRKVEAADPERELPGWALNQREFRTQYIRWGNRGQAGPQALSLRICARKTARLLSSNHRSLLPVRVHQFALDYPGADSLPVLDVTEAGLIGDCMMEAQGRRSLKTTGPLTAYHFEWHCGLSFLNPGARAMGKLLKFVGQKIRPGTDS